MLKSLIILQINKNLTNKNSLYETTIKRLKTFQPGFIYFVKKNTMKILHYIAAISFLATPIFAANSLEGEYVGKVDAKEGYFKDNPLIAAQVYREGNEYKVVIYPDLWRRAQPYVKFNANANLDKIEFDQGGWNAFKGTISKNEITGVAIYSTKEGKKSAPMKLSKIKRKSPTLGKRPPKGAIKLIDGKSFDEWVATNGQPIRWEIVGDGSVKVSDTVSKWVDIATKKKFKNIRLHVEFMTPDERSKPLGQGRGNSGVFVGGFEVQVLDSFGSEGLWNECGALYKYLPPQINASLPPEKWQTYDIEYHSPVFENGKMVKFPRITVFHNGMKIHGDVELREATANGSAYRSITGMKDEPFSIRLQNHMNPVKYRNVWVQEID